VSAPAPAAPRPRLDRETIVRTVLEIGVARFSMHAVARRLGVSPSAFAIVEEALGVLRAAGFGPEAAWRAYTLVVNHAFRAVQGQEQFAALQERTGPGAFRLFQLSEAERRRYPEVARVGASLRFDFDESFARSLACIVAGLEVQRARGAL